MDDRKTYPVLSRIRHSGVVYTPKSERSTIALSDKEAKRLQPLGCIGEAESTDDATSETDFVLKDALVALISEGHDVKSLNMADLGKLLGANARGVKRADVEAALAEINQEAAA
jgi:hypothetical protein